jgi:hypothetical protein
MLPSGAAEPVTAPAVTLTVGSPNRFASAGARKTPVRPLTAKRAEPSANTVNFASPDTFSVMVFPVCRFVYETLKKPVRRKIIDPSEAFSSFSNLLSAWGVTRTLNPQNGAGKVKGCSAGRNCHLGPRARAGEAVITPPEHAQQRVERHEHPNSPHGNHPPLFGHPTMA